MTDREKFYIVLIVIVTLSLILLGSTFVLCLGLFFDQVDNKEIFRILGQALSMVIGAFVGFVGGLKQSGVVDSSGGKG